VGHGFEGPNVVTLLTSLMQMRCLALSLRSLFICIFILLFTFVCKCLNCLHECHKDEQLQQQQQWKLQRGSAVHTHTQTQYTYIRIHNMPALICKYLREHILTRLKTRLHLFSASLCSSVLVCWGILGDSPLVCMGISPFSPLFLLVESFSISQICIYFI